MIPMRLTEIARVVGGTVHGDPDVVVTEPAYVDSRRPVPGGLFVAVVGERVDGHDFADGAHAVLGSRPTAAPTVVVDDPVGALGRLARHVVDRLDVTTLALTGSQGKTGTKDYLARVLADDGPTVATAANLNNEIGVPLTALRATDETRYLVVEMGARGVGHIAYLCGIAPPDIAAVLNVGTAHIGEFGSRRAIARAKGEILEALPATGVGVVAADDPLCVAMAERTDALVLTFGTSGDVVWRDVSLDELGRPSFELADTNDPGAWQQVTLRQTGVFQVANAVAAAAMARAAGLEMTDIAGSLGRAEAVSAWRMEVTERTDGLVVLNDAYNANPASTVAALETLREVGRRQGRRTVAVLGEMKELGDEHVAGHEEVGRAAAAAADVLVVVGDGAAPIADGARSSTGWGGEVVLTASRAAAVAWVRKNARADDVLLVKASRAAGLEEVARELLAGDADLPSEGDAT